MDDEEIAYAQENDPRWGLVGGWANQVEDTVERVADAYQDNPQQMDDALELGVYPAQLPEELYEQPSEQTYDQGYDSGYDTGGGTDWSYSEQVAEDPMKPAPDYTIGGEETY